MPYGMYMSAEGAQAQSRRLEVIANNMANVNTVGFKPDAATFQARFAEAIQEGHAAAGSRSINDIGGGVKVIETLTNFSAGDPRSTNKDSDLMIIGSGFFQVEGPDGGPLLTRAGDMKLDNEGGLRTANGLRVLDAGGSPIQLLSDVPWTVSKLGVIQQAGNNTPLALVEPESVDELTKVGANMFRARGEVNAVPVAAREVRAGYLEMSGANPTQQMMAMIETSRAFEANARMIQTQDGATNSLVSRLLRTS